MMEVQEMITKEWLENVLESSNLHASSSKEEPSTRHHVRICSFHPERALAKGENYASITFRTPVVYVLVNDDGEVATGSDYRVDLFIKLLPSGAEHRKTMQEARFFDREAEFYNETLPDFRANIKAAGAPGSCLPDLPNCIHANPSGEMTCVIMDDLARYGYKVADR
jgi:hypothetical protein